MPLDSKGQQPMALISGADRAAVMERFGAVPSSSAVPLLPPPPPPINGVATVAQLNAHAQWLNAWKAIRHDGLGASEVPAVAGCEGAYGSPFALFWQKTQGIDAEFDEDEVLVMGTRLEVVIGQVWQERHPDVMLVRPGAGIFRHPFFHYLLATPDFIAVTNTGGVVGHEPVECKAYDGGKGWGTPGTDEVPEHIECQVLMQCEVLDAPRGHVVRMRGKKVTSYVVERYPQGDEGRRRAMVDQWLDRAEDFVANVRAGTPPPLDGSDATSQVLGKMYDMDEGTEARVPAALAASYILAQVRAADAKRNLADVRNRVRSAMGTAEFALNPDGRRIAQRRVGKRMGYTVPPGVVDGVWPVQ